ncbi:hypothetical protein Cni_G07429 [Canna indica]|uniref:Uncharacterized protein n=1 Tax=Canna indica TaxID=4628 RepID=A0AAQ3K127_9LILI|nr:hypothetical protein Cni_G07429 [Canna indica]
MACLTWFPLSTKTSTVLKRQLISWRPSKLSRQLQRPIFHQKLLRNLSLRCSNVFPWEASPPYTTTEDGDGIIKGSNIVEPITAQDELGIPIFQGEEDVIDMKNQPTSMPLQQHLKWPMWLLGPCVLLVTGMAPTLWLPLSSVFLGPNIAGLLSLVGLDCLFNMGATLFLLMADSCGRQPRIPLEQKSQAPLTYRLWNLVASILGFLAPIVLLFASRRGYLEPNLSFISFAVLLGPYLLLLSVQMLTEMLTWHWRSPVWLVTPVVYEAYRVLQLMRGLKLAGEIGAPAWMMVSIRVLVSWWILILGVQLMRVAWFAGFASQMQLTGSD